MMEDPSPSLPSPDGLTVPPSLPHHAPAAAALNRPGLGRRLAPFGISAAVFALDQITKLLIRSNYSTWDTQVIIPGFFNIVHAENSGAAFSLLADAAPWVRMVVLIGLAGTVALLIALALLGRFGICETRTARVAFALILGGASGNLLDRIAIGTVTDFLEFYYGRYYWPSFNVADSAISIGAGLLILDFWLTRNHHKQPANVS